MKFKCEVFIPLTHKTYGIAGCYGCENVTINVDLVSCSEGHWSMPMLVPVMEDNSDSFDCSEHQSEIKSVLSLCNDCHFLDYKRNRCKLGKELKEVVVRLD